MKIKYMGTAAAEAIPALGCDCAVCKNARENGGKDVRFRTQALVNEDLLIDFPAETILNSVRFNVDYKKIKFCLISHSHSDHLAANELEFFGRRYVKTERTEPLHFYAGESGYNLLKVQTDTENLSGRADVSLIKPFEKFFIGDYSVLPLPAAHSPATFPMIFLIEQDGKKALWAHDTGYFPTETLDALKSVGRLDFVSLDCCAGFLTNWRAHHMGLDMIAQLLEKLKADKVADEKTIKVINHFSHNCQGTHEMLSVAAEQHGMTAAYDGMEVEF